MALSGQTPVRRRLRRPRLRPRRAHRCAAVASLGSRTASAAAASSTRRRRVAYGRVFIGNTDGKVVRLRRGDRQSALVDVDRRLRLLVPSRVAAARVRRLLRRQGGRARCRDRGAALGVPDRRPGLGLADRDGWPRLRRHASKPHGRARRAHREARLVVPRRPVHAARGRPRPPVPRRACARVRARSRVVASLCADALPRHRRRRLHRLAPRRVAPCSSGHDVVAVDALTDSYDPSRKRENVEAFELVEVDLVETDVDALLAGCDGVFHLAGQPGVRASFGPDFAPLPAPERARDRDAVRGGGAPRVAGRLRVVVVGVRRRGDLSDVRGAPPRPISPYGVTKLACEQLAYALASSAGLEAVGLRYFTVYGPRQRPDMAFTRLLEALVDGHAFPLFGDGHGVAELHLRRMTRSRRRWPHGARPPRRALQRRRGRGGDDRRGDSRSPSRLPVASSRSSAMPRPPATCGGRAPTSRRARVSSAGRPSTSLAEGLAAQWAWVAGRVAAR